MVKLFSPFIPPMTWLLYLMPYKQTSLESSLQRHSTLKKTPHTIAVDTLPMVSNDPSMDPFRCDIRSEQSVGIRKKYFNG